MEFRRMKFRDFSGMEAETREKVVVFSYWRAFFYWQIGTKTTWFLCMRGNCVMLNFRTIPRKEAGSEKKCHSPSSGEYWDDRATTLNPSNGSRDNNKWLYTLSNCNQAYSICSPCCVGEGGGVFWVVRLKIIPWIQDKVETRNKFIPK
jgi:hypothetical protein